MLKEAAKSRRSCVNQRLTQLELGGDAIDKIWAVEKVGQGGGEKPPPPFFSPFPKAKKFFYVKSENIKFSLNFYI